MLQLAEKFIGDIPWPIRALLLIGGSLMSAFSSKFPEALQTAGLCVGIAIALLGVLATVWHSAKKSGRGRMIVGFGLLLLGCLLGVIGLSIIAAGERYQLPEILASSDAPFLVEFPGNEQLRPDDLFVRPLNIGVVGDNIDNFISSESIRFKLTNANKTTTRNVEVFVTQVAYTNGLAIPLKIALPRVSSQSSNLRPKEANYFQLVEFLNPKWSNPLGGVKHISKEELDSVKWLIQPNWMSPIPIGVYIPTIQNSQHRENRPVRTSVLNIDVEIYADDLPVTFARFTLTDPKKIKVKLVSQGLSLPPLATVEIAHEEKK